ncbi:glycosyltransferase [Halobacteria archaeon AArc-dxtr1]|nr:glycosyltransferase [Halobacteria archaeon AArc-dxtr1]
MTPTVGIVVPAFRPDVDVLGAYVREIDDALAPDTIRIELDEPREGTVESLSALPAMVNAVPERRGKGAAITAGFCALETDVLAFVDADASTPVDSLVRVVDRVRGGETAVATGSRRHPEAEVTTHQSRLRRRLGDGFAWLARHVLSLSLSDYQCGAKAIDATAWADVRGHLREPGFAWDVEFLAVADALGYRVEDVPITWADAPESTVSTVGTGRELVTGLFATRHRVKRLRGDRIRLPLPTRRSAPEPLVDRVRKR